MEIRRGHIGVVTGAGTGIGRALAIELSTAGVHLSICDIADDAIAQTVALCQAGAPVGTRVHSFHADVSREAEVLAFRDAAMVAHATDHIHLLFNNAGVGGGGSFVDGDRESWDHTFAVCWSGVYFVARAFLPLLVASSEGCIVNVSSVNGFWARLGRDTPITSYSTAKFAVKGFTEALIGDLRLHAPHVSCALVMPGHVSTQIAQNSQAAFAWTTDRLAAARRQLLRAGESVDELDDEGIVEFLRQRAIAFRDTAPLSAAQAAKVILDGVRAGRWRILVGEDAERLDRWVRADPENAYEPPFAQALAEARSLGAQPAPRDSNQK